jgi:hypothetical protein
LEAQQKAVGAAQAAVINVTKALASGTQRFMPENLAITAGGGGDSVGVGPLVPQLMRWLQSWDRRKARTRDDSGNAAESAPPPAEPAGGPTPAMSAMRWAITPRVAAPRTPAN